MTSFNLAFSSLRARFRLTRSARLLAKTWAYELAACSAEAVCPACSLAAGSVQRVSACFSRALFSVMNAGHSLLVAGCAPSQFGHLTDSLFGQSSCLWPVPEHNGQTFSVARQVLAPWPNCWHLKQRLGRGMYGVTSNLSKPREMCSGRVGASKVRKNVPVCTFLPPLVMITLLVSFTWGEPLLRQDMLRSLVNSSGLLQLVWTWLRPWHSSGSVGWDLDRHITNLVQFHQIDEVSLMVNFH